MQLNGTDFRLIWCIVKNIIFIYTETSNLDSSRRLDLGYYLDTSDKPKVKVGLFSHRDIVTIYHLPLSRDQYLDQLEIVKS